MADSVTSDLHVTSPFQNQPTENQPQMTQKCGIAALLDDSDANLELGI